MLSLTDRIQGALIGSAIGGTNIGRDSDTIAGRAAMLAGTLRGAGNVPAAWVAMFRKESLQKISRNAALFCELIETKKLPRLRLRQNVSSPDH